MILIGEGRAEGPAAKAGIDPQRPAPDQLTLLARYDHERGRNAHDLVTAALRTLRLCLHMLGDGLGPLERLPALLTTLHVGSA